MMNPLIKKQLESCGPDVPIPEFTDTTLQITIPKRCEYLNVELKLGHTYIVELADALIHPPQDSSLHSNWNNNVIPTNKHMKICVQQLMGTMVKVCGIGVNIDTSKVVDSSWTGWCPKNLLKIIQEV